MCGLFGMAGPGVQAEDLIFMRELAYTSGLRGTDATGMFQAGVFKKHSYYRLEKGRSEVSYFLWFHENHEDGNPKILADVTDNVFMGHARAATKGELTDENAHPFDVGEIVGAHNGTLYDKKYQDKKKTDSELFIRDIQERGLEAVLKGLDKGSAYALTLFDKKTGELTFARNDKRPLNYAYHNKRKVLYWASERGMLEFVAQRQNWGTGIDIGKVFRFTENVIYTVHPHGVNAGKLPDYTAKHIIPLWLRKEEEEAKQKAPLITHGTTERENLTNVLLLPERKPLNLNLRKGEAPTKEGLTPKPCVYCRTPMDLLAQYEGVEIKAGEYICKPCDLINSELMKEHLNKHSPKGLII